MSSYSTTPSAEADARRRPRAAGAALRSDSSLRREANADEALLDEVEPSWKRALLCLLVALVALGFYRATLLPGFDLGDTASFQTIAGNRVLTARQAYPVYYAIGRLFVAFVDPVGAAPARAMNLASAVSAAAACGLLAWSIVSLTRSLVAGAFGGLLFAFSYTLWTQAIIAEVYGLAMLFAAASLAALLRWAHRPSLRAVALFFSVYGLSFGNHLSMILWLPGFAWLLVGAPGAGMRYLFRPRIVALALAAAIMGALPYGWNLHGLLTSPDRPESWLEIARSFWFDVTKSDWRDSMVGSVPLEKWPSRAAMYWFDLRQQFGIIGIGTAALGAIALARHRPRVAAPLLLSYAVATAFAFTYNVGDTHVFYLPSHFLVALWAGVGLAALAGQLRPTGVSLAPLDGAPRSWRPGRTALASMALLAYVAWRAADTYPAVDRSDDRRPTAACHQLSGGLDHRNAIYATQLPWELQNGMDYCGKYVRPELVFFRLSEALKHLPFLVNDNREIGRATVASAQAAEEIRRTYGSLFTIVPDPRVRPSRLVEIAARIPPGSIYALAHLVPAAPVRLDVQSMDEASVRLSGAPMPRGRYCVVLGVAGERPALVLSSERPFRTATALLGRRVEVRMESWLAFDTIRRAGFGSVIVDGHRALTIELGASLVGLDPAGRPLVTGYEGGLYAPQRRYLVEARF